MWLIDLFLGVNMLNKDNVILSKAVTAACVRNTYLEELHSGKTPVSLKGDNSDVYVIDAGGNKIPWNGVSRISDEEMKKLMKEVVNNMYKFFENQYNEEYCEKVLDYNYKFAANWDDPEE